jgi:hypothetical protein
MHYIAHLAFKGGMATGTGFLFVLTHKPILIDEAVRMYAEGA